MNLTIKKNRETGEYDVLDLDDVKVASVYQRETSKTGFRRGYCIGQVTCKAWFTRINGREHGYNMTGRSGPRWFTRRALLAELPKLLEEQKGKPS